MGELLSAIGGGIEGLLGGLDRQEELREARAREKREVQAFQLEVERLGLLNEQIQLNIDRLETAPTPEEKFEFEKSIEKDQFQLNQDRGRLNERIFQSGLAEEGTRQREESRRARLGEDRLTLERERFERQDVSRGREKQISDLESQWDLLESSIRSTRRRKDDLSEEEKAKNPQIVANLDGRINELFQQQVAISEQLEELQGVQGLPLVPTLEEPQLPSQKPGFNILQRQGEAPGTPLTETLSQRFRESAGQNPVEAAVGLLGPVLGGAARAGTQAIQSGEKSLSSIFSPVPKPKPEDLFIDRTTGQSVFLSNKTESQINDMIIQNLIRPPTKEERARNTVPPRPSVFSGFAGL